MKKYLSIALLLFAPFAVAAQAVKPGVKKTYNIAEHGAVADGTTLNTKAIQALIDECAKKGGTLIIPKGVFLTGALFLKPGVNIEMKEGSVIKGSQNIEDYPKMNRRIEGHSEPWRMALLNADKCDHLQITGKGTLDGSGEPFWKLFYSRRTADATTTNLSVERPQLCFIQNCHDVRLSGIQFLNSGFWNLHVYHDQQVTIDNCRFIAPGGRVPDNHAPSSDGIDVDSSQDITIGNCYFSVGDDDIALKGSKGPFALQDKDSPPVERIHIHDCVFESGGGVMTCGSEATFVRDVDIKNCIARNVNVLRLKLRPDTPQQYENISLTDITMDENSVLFSIAPWSQYFDLKGQPPPKSLVRNITITNVKGSGSSLGKITGNPTTEFGTMLLKNVDLKLKNGDINPANIKGLTVENVMVNGVAATGNK